MAMLESKTSSEQARNVEGETIYKLQKKSEILTIREPGNSFSYLVTPFHQLQVALPDSWIVCGTIPGPHGCKAW